MNQTAELAPRPVALIRPVTLEEHQRYAEILAASDLVPSDFKGKPGNVLVAVQLGAEVGLHPMQALQSIAVINGRPCMWGDAVLGVVQASGKLDWITETDDGETATCTVQRHGYPEPTVRTFSTAEAVAARLIDRGTVWKSYPKRMRQMRARAFALRDGFADVLKGVAVREEVEDFEPTVRVEAPAAANPLMPRQRSAESVGGPPASPAPTTVPPTTSDAPVSPAPPPPASPTAPRVTFTLHGKVWETAGITEAQLLETFRLEALLKKKQCGELVKVIGKKEFKIEHRRDLTEEQADRFIIRLKECAGEIA